MHEPKSKHEIRVDPDQFPLEAQWGRPTTIEVITDVFRRARNETVALAYLTIFGLAAVAGVEADDTVLLLGAFLAIAIIAVASEYFKGNPGQDYDNAGKTTPDDAAEHEGGD